MRIETKLVHAGEPRPRPGGAVSMPIFQSSTFEHAGEGNYHDVRYLRLNNTPNHVVLHDKLAALEGAQAALVTGSGMAAISATLLTLLSAGDHLRTPTHASSCSAGLRRSLSAYATRTRAPSSSRVFSSATRSSKP